MAASSNSRIRSLDIPVIDRVFGMEGGYELPAALARAGRHARLTLRILI